MARELRTDQRKRFAQIIEVLRRNEISKGITPDKLAAIMEELGPTFIKLGQILSMRSDFLPQEYCDALVHLQTHVEPMPFEQVKSILEDAFGRSLQDVFSFFEPTALGSASIAQVHAAELPSGEKVVVKVQREGIHEVMNRDIILLKKAAEALKYTPHHGLVDFNRVLDEMWVVAQQEMNFLTEAQNLETFSRLNADTAYITAPKVFPTYSTGNVLVMERIDGIPINDKEAMVQAGYDLDEIGLKLADNYVKQLIEDGFFHADTVPIFRRARPNPETWLFILTIAISGSSLAEMRLESCWSAIVPVDRIMLLLPSFPCPALPPWAGRTFLTDRRRAMTEYEKLITAEQIAHTVEITECLTGKTGMANTCAGRVALFYGAEDGNDDKIVTPRTFSRQFKITAAILG